jgi:hypothetical protein
MKSACNILRLIPEGGNGRRIAFNEMAPFFGLIESEMDAQFERVCEALRYEADTLRDVEALQRFRVPHLSCRVQAALTHRSRLI